MDEDTGAFGLVWPGKAIARQLADGPEQGGWHAERSDTHGFAHAFYEGDNIEALKHLAGSLTGGVRVIYIDPPYNTGQAMRYPDNFRMGLRDYVRTHGRQAGTESERRGRMHAAWLSMILPRLVLARRLLAPDGVLFVSIDDNESHHLRTLLDEVFGPENFVATVVWRKKVVRGRGARHVLPQTEYIHVYARDLTALPPFCEPLTDAMRDAYGKSDEQGPYKLIPLAKSGTSHSPRPNLVYPIEAPDGSAIACPTHQWRWSRETLAARRDEIAFQRNRKDQWVVYTKQRLHLPDGERERTPISYYDRVTTTDGTAELKRLFGRVVIDFPKPSALIRDLITWVTPRDGPHHEVILDFFAGSCPTAQAVLELNAADGGSRRFICVQVAEPTDDPEFATIAEIGKERIRRVIAQRGETDDPPSCQLFTWRPE